MEIICNQNELNNAIQLVSKAVASRPTHPILANIYQNIILNCIFEKRISILQHSIIQNVCLTF